MNRFITILFGDRSDANFLRVLYQHIQLLPQEPVGCDNQGTGRCGDTRGRSMSSSERRSAEIERTMIMIQLFYHN